MGRVAYIRNRIGLMVFVLFGVTIVIFGMVRVLPGDPAFLILGDRATEESAAALRVQLGLTKPLLEQYWDFMSGIPQGKFGMSLLYRQPVGDLVLRRVPVSIYLAMYAMVLAAIITLTFGITAALEKGRFADHAIRVVFLLFLTTPSFWLGILLILFFSLRLRILPVAGYGETFVDHVRYLFLPALTLALGLSAVLIRQICAGRSSWCNVLITCAQREPKASLRGQVLQRHVLRNALMPVITIFGLQFGYLVGGTVVVETVFAIPGMGQLLIQSITARDYPVVQAITLISAFLVIIVNLAVDISYSFLDPRVTYE